MEKVKTNKIDLKDLIGKKEFNPLTRPFAVIVRCSELCNYKCSYCYAEHNSKIPIMPTKTIRSIIEKVLDYVSPERIVHFIYHGGEPLYAGFEFFKSVVDICNDNKNRMIKNSIQTNGSLLTEDFTEFCMNNNISISLSIDGPKFIHNSNRLDKEGRGTFDNTLKAVKLLKNNNLNVSCVSVLHQENIDHLEETYNFFKKNQISFRINPIVKAGNAINKYNSLAISPEEYGNVMCKLFDLWFEDDFQIRIEPLHTIIGNIIYPEVWGCIYQGRCLEHIISINPDGNIFPCGRFAGLDNFLIGNIDSCTDLNTLFKSEIYKELINRNPIQCSRCDFVEICNGGCLVTAYMNNSDIHDVDYYCIGRKKMFKHIISKLNLTRFMKNLKEE